MAHSIRSCALSVLLLGIFLGGCATTSQTRSTGLETETAGAPPSSAAATSPDTHAPAVETADGVEESVEAAATPVTPVSVAAAKEAGDAPGERPAGPVFRNSEPPATPVYVDERDPWEPVNRKIFAFNESVDDYVFKPVARSYRWIVPDPVEMAVGNVFSNLGDLPNTVNNLLQLRFDRALTSSMRFVVNSTFGLAGLVDLASDIGLEKRDADFGQTMGHHGVASGPYLVLPFLGPSTARDAGGRMLDIASDPVFIGSFFVAPFIGPIVGSVKLTDKRAGLLKSEKTLDEAALDKYEFVRDAYLQQRRSLIHEDGPPPTDSEE
ncbi:VacJ family lipoprotein [Nitrosovibrio sp. Nv17]|uniref:MlaA family lipoprotein n=1 Tax=Nitrosovibrio sp. Nv17 TaxID=1855339 RepID=UPI000908BD3A|nr:MlaA family lipoprotein [Nitrosovibrio sp. Nv17]SFW28911.1 phospholipid-binding lipoprotein MlaA [Nitrosovibrio sp. Nv17]